ncbi:MAG: hypothetical protein WC466_10620 [Candidatus Izemoplasmatales bacterium]
MALYNQNYEAKLLTVAGSPYTTADLGNNITASTVHQVFCLSAGTISITALGGGSFTWSASTSESMDIMAGACSVISGEFVGFKSKFNSPQKPYYRY